MIRAKNLYEQNIMYVREYGKLYDILASRLPVLSKQAESLLRAQWVMAVSALDTFIHDILRIGLVEMFSGVRPVSHSAQQYMMSFNAFKAILDASTEEEKKELWDNEIRRINSKDTYQSPQSIEYAMSILGIGNLWSNISTSMGLNAVDIKTKLALIIRRRNQIAHESDINSVTSTQIPINKSDVDDVTGFMDSLVHAIYGLL